MKKKTLYTCEICHTDYADKEKAAKCEKSHTADLVIVETKYHPFNMCGADSFPVKIVVKDIKTGKTAMYRR